MLYAVFYEERAARMAVVSADSPQEAEEAFYRGHILRDEQARVYSVSVEEIHALRSPEEKPHLHRVLTARAA